MQLKQVRLTLTTTRFVTSAADDEVAQGKTLVMPAVTFMKAVAFAETAGVGFRAPRRAYMPAQTVAFARALKEAMSRKFEVVAGPRASSRFMPDTQLHEFFAQRAQARWLTRLLAFIEGGGSLDVQDA